MYNALALVAFLFLSGPDTVESPNAAPRTNTSRRAAVNRDSNVSTPTPPIRTSLPFPPAAQTASPPTTLAPFQENAAATDPNIVRTRGILEVPKWNNVILAANYQSMLMTLRTEKRDLEGNTIRDENGNPIVAPLREGMYVFKDQVLGNFDDRELHIQLAIEEKKLDVAIKAQEKKIEVVYAARGVQTSTASLKMFEEANRRHEGAITPMEILKAQLEVYQAEANLDLQKYTIDVERTAEVRVKEQEVEGMKVRIELRKLIAPISGMIVKIEKAEGEWLREGDPVLEIVQLDTLRARCKIDAKQYTPEIVDGKDVTVYMPAVDGKVEEFPGKVVFADPRVSVGDEFEVFIEVQNRPVGRAWRLQPGRTVSAAIRL